MLKIGDFAKLAQVSTKTVRHYDKKGLLKPALIDRFTGYRYYTGEQISRLNQILALKEFGFTLDQIQTLLSKPLPLDELHGMFRLKMAELEKHVEEEQARLARIADHLKQIEQGNDLFLSMISHQKETIEMTPDIVTKPAFAVIGMRYFGDNKDGGIPKLWGTFLPRSNEIQDKAALAYGVCGEMDENGRFHYLAGYETTSTEVPEGMDRWELTEQTYAIFPCTIDNIGETYSYIFEKWLPQSDYKLAKVPDFEYYPENFDPQHNKGMAIYMPVLQ
ncbi:MAG: effector binding domain-containing protein [Chloroflexota bacterium]